MNEFSVVELRLTTIAQYEHNLDVIIDNQLKPFLKDLSSVDMTGENRLAMAKYVKKECNSYRKSADSNFIAFDKKYNEAKKPIDEKRKLINTLIDELKVKAQAVIDEEQTTKLQQKYATAEEYYNTTPISKLIDFERVKGADWKNEGKKPKDIQKDIDTLVKRVESELLTINSLDGATEFNLQEYYLQCLDLEQTIKQLGVLKENKRKLDEQTQEVVDMETGEVTEKTPRAVYAPLYAPASSKDVSKLLEITTTAKKYDMLLSFMIEYDIEYSEV